MKRDYQLRYCLICTNRKHDRMRGVICGLTNKIPTFQTTCPDYNKDQPEFEKICKEKARRYGLTIKKSTFQLFVEEYKDTYLTTFNSFVKPRSDQDLGDEFHVTRSKIKYLLLSIIPITFFLLPIPELSPETNQELIPWMILCLGALLGIIYDYFNNRNSFRINSDGLIHRGELISWKLILGTIIRDTQYEKHLIALVPTKTDIEIKLNGLIGPTQKIENYIELYKKQNANK